jgi:hypothetical protein
LRQDLQPSLSLCFLKGRSRSDCGVSIHRQITGANLSDSAKQETRHVNKGKYRQRRTMAGVVVTSLADNAGSLEMVGAYATVNDE